MHSVFDLIATAADSASTVLIEGETGTGKEQVARAIHYASCRRRGPLVAVNCAALPEGLLETDLFGHEKGSFPSAVGQRPGRFEIAHGGTLFLDEVANLPLPMQAKLLRVLQERCFERVGGLDTIDVDVRVIAATNRPLLRLVQHDRFRDDLYHRLNVVKIDLPSLRDRREDIPLLVTHFIEKYTRPGEYPGQIASAAMETLVNYRWPGNVRELENAIERACVTCRDNVIQPDNLPLEIGSPSRPTPPYQVTLDRPLPKLLEKTTARVELQYIRRALKRTRGNVSRCARMCGMSRRSITAKIAKYRLDTGAFREV